MSTLRGNVSLSLTLAGQESVARSLRSAQDGLDRLGGRARDAAGDVGTASGSIAASLGGIPGRLTDIYSGFQLAIQGAQMLAGAVASVYNEIKEGEVAANVDRIFQAVTADATEAMQSLREASQGLVDDTSLQQAANRLRLVGFETSQIAKLVDASMQTQIATGENWKGTLDKLSTAILSGRKASLERLGVMVDLEAETNRVAFATERAAESFTKQELVAIRLQAVTDALARKFQGLPLDQLTLRAQQAKTDIDNLRSEFDVWLATMGESPKTIQKAAAAATDAAVAFDPFATTLERLGSEALASIGTEGGRMADALRSAAAEIQVSDSATAQTLRANADVISTQAYGVTESAAQDLARTLERLSLRRREQLRQEIDDELQAARERQAVIDAQIDEINAAIDAEDQTAEEARRAREQREREREAAAKAAGARRAQIARDVARLELDAQLRGLEQSSAIGAVQARLWRDLARIREDTTAGDLAARRRALQESAAIAKAQAEVDKIQAQEAAQAQRAAIDESRALQDVWFQQQAANTDRADALGKADLARREALIAVDRQLQDGRISEELAAERRRLADLQYLAVERAELDRQATERARQAQEETQSALSAYNAMAMGAQRSGSTAARAMGTMSALVSAVALQQKALAQGSTAAILAIGEQATAGIKSDRAIAAVRAAMATALGFYNIATGNYAGAAAAFTSAAAYGAIAGGGGGGGSSASAMPSLASAGPSAPSFAPSQGSQGGGVSTFIVEGWRGQDLMGQIAGDAERARRNGIDRRRL